MYSGLNLWLRAELRGLDLPAISHSESWSASSKGIGLNVNDTPALAGTRRRSGIG
jgi:hypothetical protein